MQQISMHFKFAKVLFLVLITATVQLSVHGQTTVTYTTNTANFNTINTEKNNNPPYGGTYNNGAELAQYANGGSFGNTPGAAAFETFNTTGNGISGSARTLKVGDRFTITVYTGSNPSSGGRIGISFRNTTSVTNFFSSTDGNTIARFQIDNTGGWKIYSGSTTVENTGATSGSDRTLTIEVTSSNTFNATIAGTTYYDLSFATTGPIAQLCIYSFGDNNPNSFWKNASLTNFGHAAGDGLRFGYNLTTGTRTVSGIISDGVNTNATSGTLANKVLSGGSTSFMIFSGNNTYTGSTTINTNARLELQHANALGVTSGVTVQNDATLSMYFASGNNTFATYATTLNGSGQGSANGALRSTGGNNTWPGAITLASSSRINADVTGAAGSLVLQGTIGLSSNTLTVGGASANVTASGIISGTGAIIKDGSNNFILSNASNSYSGLTTVSAGTLQLGAGSTSSSTGPLGSTAAGTSVTSGATLDMNGFSLITSATEGLTLNGTGTATNGALINNSGTATTWAGAVSLGSAASVGGTGDMTISGLISGAFSLTKYGAGKVTLTNTSNSYSGGNTISSGTVSIANNAVLGSGGLSIGNGSTSTTLDVTDNTTRSGTLTVVASTTAGVLNVASGKTFILSGAITSTGSDAATKFGKSGPGILQVEANGSTYPGQIQIGEGSVIIKNNGGLGTNTSTGNRGIDLGLNVGDVQMGNSVSVYATTGITVPQSIYVAPNTSFATRTIGLSGTGSATFNNEIFLGGNLTVTGGDGTVTLSGAIVNTSGLIIDGGTTILSGTNTFTGTTTVNTGTLSLGNTAALGATSAGTTVTSGALLDVNGINYASAEPLTINGTGLSSAGALINNSGTAATWAGTIALATASSIGGTGNLTISGVISGSNTLTKVGAGTITLTNSNTYNGATTVSAGELAVSGTLTATSYTINGGTLRISADNRLPDASTVSLSTGTFAVDFNETISNLNLSGGTLNVAAGKTLTINGTLDLSNNPTITLGAGATIVYGASGTLLYSGSTSRTPGVEWPTSSSPLNVTINNTGGITLAADRTINGVLTIASSCSLNASTFAVAGATLTTSGTGTLQTQNVGATPLPTGRTWSFAVTFSGASAQTIPAGTYNGTLTLNNAAGATLAASATAGGALTLTSGDLTIGTSNTLTVNGAVSGSGNLVGSSTSGLTIGGTAGALNFASGARTLRTLTLNASSSATLGTALDIAAGSSGNLGTLTVGSGVTLTTGGNLVLKSDGSGTARVGQSSGTVSGDVTVERFIP
ncbi:MAG: beta strand repeat-containing protein, partial [Ferruginibacter sp.]